jgi:hypothetical protein
VRQLEAERERQRWRERERVRDSGGAVSWIYIGFSADPDPTFYLNADPDPGQTLPTQKAEFSHEKKNFI